MKPDRRNLSDLITLARRAQPPAAKPEDRREFVRQTVAAWKRGQTNASPPDSLQLWERTGLWSLATATAIVLAVALLRPTLPPPTHNPFDIVLNVSDDSPLF